MKSWRAISRVALAVALGAACGSTATEAQVYPPGFNDELVVADLTAPTCLAFAPDGRIFIGEHGGTIRIYEGGQLLPTPLLTLAIEPFSDQGLLGMALALGFPTEPYLFVYYTPATGHPTGNTNRLSRFTVIGDATVPGSEVVVLDSVPGGDAFHLGGCVRLAPDGTVFVSTGDTGWLSSWSQDRSRLEGKLLRINADGTVPPDNPFVGQPGIRPEIFQWGLRNPFRFCLQPGTGVPFIADVGYETWEEIDAGPPGANFGWPTVEGPPVVPDQAFVDPLFAYDHGLGSAAVVGSVFYQGSNFPAEYVGNLFFFDHPRGHLGRMVLGPSNQVLSVTMPFIQTAASGNVAGPVDLQLGPDGTLYYATYAPGAIRRIYYSGAGNRAPTAIATAQPSAGYAPLTVAFDGSRSYDVDGDSLDYEWNFGDGGAPSAEASAAHVYTVNGTWNATLTARDGRGGIATSPAVRVTVGNLPPTVTIAEPTANARFVVGQPVTFAGSAFDVEEGALPASSLHWAVTLHHLTHIHPVVQDLVGAGGSFVPDAHGEELANLSYEIIAWATDVAGLRGEARTILLPDPAQPQPVVRTYNVDADDRDAVSRQSQVRVSGYSGADPIDYVSSDAEQLITAVEFSLDIPVGATVQDAVLEVHAGQSQFASPTGAMLVRAYDVDSASPFVSGDFGDLRTHHPLMPIDVSWPAPTAWVPGDDAASPNLSPLVQAFIDRPDYVPGAWLGLVVSEGSTESGHRYGWTDFAAGGVGTRLRVVYVPLPTPSGTPVTSPGRPRPLVTLLPNAPNPFNPATSLPFLMARAGDVRLTILDPRGRRIRTLLTASLPAGRHSATWNGLDDDGRAVASGVYIARVESLGDAATRTVTLVR